MGEWMPNWWTGWIDSRCLIESLYGRMIGWLNWCMIGWMIEYMNWCLIGCQEDIQERLSYYITEWMNDKVDGLYFFEKIIWGNGSYYGHLCITAIIKEYIISVTYQSEACSIDLTTLFCPVVDLPRHLRNNGAVQWFSRLLYYIRKRHSVFCQIS